MLANGLQVVKRARKEKKKTSQTSLLDHSGTSAFNDSALKLSECFPYREHKIVFCSVCRQNQSRDTVVVLNLLKS